MKELKKSSWIEKGYLQVSESGFNSLNIESIARKIQKNKSSFYHYFGSMDVFIDALLQHHLKRADEFSTKIRECETIRPEMVDLFIEYRPDLFFHKQLRINRDNPDFKKCFEIVFGKYEQAILDQWAKFLGLNEQKLFARTYLHLVSENFLLKISPETYSRDWLNDYLEDISAVLNQMNSGKSD